jgi:hypothetical protein
MYDFKAFLHYNYLAWFKAKGQHYRLTPKRIFALTVFLLIYIPTEIIAWICFGLDEIFFPNYRMQEVKSPVFIIGNPRSGTTFTHRLIEKGQRHVHRRNLLGTHILPFDHPAENHLGYSGFLQTAQSSIHENNGGDQRKYLIQ